MDKVITTALLTIAGVIAAVMVVNTMLPVTGRSSSSILSSSAAAANQIKTDVEIVTVTAIGSEIYVWVKNIGAADIPSIEDSDVFVEAVGTSFTRFTVSIEDTSADCDAAGPAAGLWNYCKEEAWDVWKVGRTVKLTITLSGAASGEYLIRFVTSNGVAVEKTFSV